MSGPEESKQAGGPERGVAFSVSEVAEACAACGVAAEALSGGAPGWSGRVVTDTRRPMAGAWFLALRGERFDAHDFLAQAVAAGCGGLIAERLPVGLEVASLEETGIAVVRVADGLAALQALGAAARDRLSGPVVGITGSAGKTSTRVMVVEVLRSLAGEGRAIHHTEGNLNNHIGVPLTLLAAPAGVAASVLELGMNHPGEIRRLAEIARPEVRLITNVGAAHVEGCGSIAGVAAAKQELFDTARSGDVLCVNEDDPWISAMPLPGGARRIGYGRGAGAEVRLERAWIGEDLRTRVEIATPAGRIEAAIGVPGLHLAQNAAAAAAVGYALGVAPAEIAAGIERFEPEGMRNRVRRATGAQAARWGGLRVEDAYNANATSMSAALQTLAALPGPRVAILGDMLELGTAEAQVHREVLAEALSLGGGAAIDRVVVLGERMARAAAALPADDRLIVAADMPDLLVRLAPILQSLGASFSEGAGGGGALLVKGSRGARMERVLAWLDGD